MGQGLATDDIRRFLEHLSKQYPHPISLYLLGGGALCLLGSPRRTVDIDFTVEAPSKEFESVVELVAQELQLEVEIIPIEEFIPLPAEAATRHQAVDRFGNLKVFIFDPYTLAISKIARGLDTDIQDVLFLLQNRFVELNKLIQFVEDAIPTAWDFDIDPKEMKTHLDIVERLHK